MPRNPMFTGVALFTSDTKSSPSTYDSLSTLSSFTKLSMDSQSLGTASAYINNLLLSRGLLRNGVAINFATPEKAEGGTGATMAKVMSLVHDLVLRRDVRVDRFSHR